MGLTVGTVTPSGPSGDFSNRHSTTFAAVPDGETISFPDRNSARSLSSSVSRSSR